MLKILNLLPILLAFQLIVHAQTEEADSLRSSAKTKKGFNFGAIPIFSFDSDVGLKYGALANFYHYGDGSRYPAYDHSLFVKWYQTTRGSSVSELKYDSERLITGYRITLDAAYHTEKALNFYGFNGYKAFYNADFEDPDHPDYISEVFYRHERKVVRLSADIQRNLRVEGLKWLLGFSAFDSKIGSVDLDKLNKGRSDEDLLPDVAGLYDLYTYWQVLPDSEINGGMNFMTKLGLVYNSCDNEADPNEGVWSEALLIFAPKAFGFKEPTGILSLQHRHYLTLIPQRLKFAYRLGYQTKIFGYVPFYLQPYLVDSRSTVDAFGGARTLRGILRNRIVGNGSAYGNFEFRSKVYETVIAKQNFHITLGPVTSK